VRVAYGLEGPARAPARLVERGRVEGERAGGGELAGEHRCALGSLQLRVAVDQLRERMVMRIRVLSHVQRRQVQAERGQRSHRPLEPPVGDQGATMRHERVAHQSQLREQLAGADVVAPLLVLAPACEPAPGVHELLLDASELQPVRLLGVQPEESRLHLGQQLQVARE
jgi:hypothetical protein